MSDPVEKSRFAMPLRTVRSDGAGTLTKACQLIKMHIPHY